MLEEASGLGSEPPVKPLRHKSRFSLNIMEGEVQPMRHGRLGSQVPTAAADVLYAKLGSTRGAVGIQLHGMNGDGTRLAGWCSEAHSLRREA